MTVSVAVQSHPDRAPLAESLARVIGAEIVWDPDPDDAIRSPWRTYREALEATPAGATHRLIVQDDVVVCQGFREAAEAALAARPGRIVVFFVGGLPSEHATRVRGAVKAGLPFALLDYMRWLPVVATAWPPEAARGLVEYVDEQNWPRAFRADDEIAGRYLRHTRQTALATAPSLVQHPDVVPSLIGKRAKAGEDKSRVAAVFDPCLDPSGIDWTLGPA